jgi:hypothetical protein
MAPTTAETVVVSAPWLTLCCAIVAYTCSNRRLLPFPLRGLGRVSGRMSSGKANTHGDDPHLTVPPRSLRTRRLRPERYYLANPVEHWGERDDSAFEHQSDIGRPVGAEGATRGPLRVVLSIARACKRAPPGWSIGRVMGELASLPAQESDLTAEPVSTDSDTEGAVVGSGGFIAL